MNLLTTMRNRLVADPRPEIVQFLLPRAPIGASRGAHDDARPAISPPRPDSGHEGVREQTQSLDLELESHPSLAIGTAEDRTKVESPGARDRPPPQRAATRPPPVPSNPDDPELRLGTVLGTYRLSELLGKGGMGYVYRAEHVKLGREVALKLLRGDYARRRDAVNRFFQEAKTVNRVRHRNIVDVTDFVELDDGTTFIIMELLRGQSLGKWARTGIDLPRALAVLIQICDGLGAAHAVGVVHRDLKPDNVFVSPTGDGAELVKLLDFGVAKLVNRDDEDVGFQTQAGSVIGTPAYMSPEQAGGMAVDQRSDIYSLGAIMYELFCGQPLFRGRSFGEFVRKHLTELPVPPRQTPGGATLDPRLEDLILHSLAKDPDERYSHILELRDGILMLLGSIETHPGFRGSSSSVGPRVFPLPGPGTVMSPPTPPASMQSSPHSAPHLAHSSLVSRPSSGLHPRAYTNHSHLPPELAPTPWWMWIAGGTCAVALGIGAAVWYAGRHGKPEPMHTKAPLTTPIVEPVPVAPPRLVTLHFDSLPSGGVYADGHSAELCRTPCAFNIDLKDGDALDHRAFVVRSEGYRDKSVTVDLTGVQREFHLTLDREEPVAAPPLPVHAKPIVKPGIHPRPLTRPDDGLEKPDGSKDSKIDPADTHDPFHRHPG